MKSAIKVQPYMSVEGLVKGKLKNAIKIEIKDDYVTQIEKANVII